MRRCQVHDVEHTQLRDRHHKHSGDDCEVFCDVVGDGKSRKAAAGNKQLLADLHHLQNFRGVAVQVHHICGLFGGGGTAVHRKAYVCLRQSGRVVGAVARHGNDLALGLFFFDQCDLVFGLALGNEAVHACLLGDRGGGKRVVARAHNGFDADGTQALKTLGHACLYRVL